LREIKEGEREGGGRRIKIFERGRREKGLREKKSILMLRGLRALNKSRRERLAR